MTLEPVTNLDPDIPTIDIERLIQAARDCVNLGLHVNPTAVAAVLNQLDLITDEYDTERHQRVNLEPRAHNCGPDAHGGWGEFLKVGDVKACLYTCQQPWRVTAKATDPHGEPVISWERA